MSDSYEHLNTPEMHLKQLDFKWNFGGSSYFNQIKWIKTIDFMHLC